MHFVRCIMRNIWIILLLFCIVFLGATTVQSEPLETLKTSHFPSLISCVKINSPLDFCGEEVPLDKEEVRERLDKELLLSLWDRPQVILWMKRSSRHLPHIEKMLKENNMPEDLKYVAIIESALRPHVSSSKRAIGFWQFTKATGRKYGLTINSDIDERRNIFTSTRAAIKYFKELRDTLGSWSLSAAAYNMGEEGLKSEILAQKTNNYYYLYLPLETQRYIFRIVSAKLILSNPEKYGFYLTKEDLYPPLQFDRIKLECSQKTPIHVIAQAGKTHFKVIKDLNPEIRGHYLSKGSHFILIPKGTLRGFRARYKKLLNQWLANNKKQVYVVKKGDNLSSIADRFNVPLPAVLIWNGLSPKRNIYPGDQLLIYSNEMKPGDIQK